MTDFKVGDTVLVEARFEDLKLWQEPATPLTVEERLKRLEDKLGVE